MTLPDFTGTWVNVETGGADVEAFCKNGLELNCAARVGFKSLNYGTGKLTHWLTASSDRMQLSTDLDLQGKKPSRMQPLLPVDGSTIDPNKHPYRLDWVPGEDPSAPARMLTTPLWDQGADRRMFLMYRSMLPDGRMKTELSYPNKGEHPSLSMWRIFEKRADEGR